MLSYTDLKPGICIISGGEPYVVLEYSFVRKQQRKPVVQTKIKSLVSGRVVEKSFYPRDTVEEAEIEKRPVKFLYHNKGEYWFCQPDNLADRFKLERELIGSSADFLKANSLITASSFEEKIISASLPIKVDLKVIEAPPAVRGNTAQGVTKQAKLETGAMINVPIFISAGDVVRINTESGEYVERVEKGKE